MAEKRYITGGMDGWLRVKRDPSGAEISIPDSLQVDLTESKEGRVILLSLKVWNAAKSFLLKLAT